MSVAVCAHGVGEGADGDACEREVVPGEGGRDEACGAKDVAATRETKVSTGYVYELWLNRIDRIVGNELCGITCGIA